MKRYANPRGTLIFILIAVTFMVAIDFFFLGGFQPAKKVFMPSRTVAVDLDETTFENSEIVDYQQSVQALDEAVFANLPQPEIVKNIKPVAKAPPARAPEKIQKTAAAPPSRHIEKPAVSYSGPPKIVIIIDDLGMDRTRSYQVLDLPAPITLAFLPYAPKLYEITAEALQKGHELLIHVPMEPMNKDMNPGPLALLDGMSHAEFDAAFEQILNSFDGYVGINNHMGSKLTQNVEIMNWVMKALHKRNLIFVDSKTINTSVALTVAAENHLSHAERDVFLDHENNIEFVRNALRRVESVARNNGQAIAIGHPKDVTIQGLKEWLPTLEKKGFKIVPVSAVTHRVVDSVPSIDLPMGPPDPVQALLLE